MKTKKKLFSFMASADDLDILRSAFGHLAFSDDDEVIKLGKRAMKAVHRCRKKHGFTWKF